MIYHNILMLGAMVLLSRLVRVQRLKHMCLPLSYRHMLSEESRDLVGRATSSLADAEPSVDQCQTRRSSIHEANHGAQTGVVVHVRGSKGDGPGDEVEDDDGGGHDLVLVGADGHFTGDGVGQGTDTEIVA